MTATNFPQWLVQTAARTRDSICSKFMWGDETKTGVADDNYSLDQSSYYCPVISKRRSIVDKIEYSDSDEENSEEESSDDEDGVEALLIPEPVPFCIDRAWKDFDSSIDNLATDILSYVSSTTPIPRQITVVNTSQELKGQEHQFSPLRTIQTCIISSSKRHRNGSLDQLPRPLSRTAPRFVHRSPPPTAAFSTRGGVLSNFSSSSLTVDQSSSQHSNAFRGDSITSSLGSEFLLNPSEDGCFLVGRNRDKKIFLNTPTYHINEGNPSGIGSKASNLQSDTYPLCTEYDDSESKSFSTLTDPFGLPVSRSQCDPCPSAYAVTRIVSPPTIRRHILPVPRRMPHCTSQEFDPSSSIPPPPLVSPENEMKTCYQSPLARDETSELSLLEMELQDKTINTTCASRQTTGGAISPHYESERDPPEQDCTSTALFTYSTQETEDSFFRSEYIKQNHTLPNKCTHTRSENTRDKNVRRKYVFPCTEEMPGTTVPNIPSDSAQQCFADGSSYSTSYNKSDFRDNLIVQAASTVKNMLMSPSEEHHHDFLLGRRPSRARSGLKKRVNRSPTDAKSQRCETKTKSNPVEAMGRRRANWFLPSSAKSEMSLSRAVSTPSQSTVSSESQSIYEL